MLVPAPDLLVLAPLVGPDLRLLLTKAMGHLKLVHFLVCWLWSLLRLRADALTQQSYKPTTKPCSSLSPPRPHSDVLLRGGPMGRHPQQLRPEDACWSPRIKLKAEDSVPLYPLDST